MAPLGDLLVTPGIGLPTAEHGAGLENAPARGDAQKRSSDVPCSQLRVNKVWKQAIFHESSYVEELGKSQSAVLDERCWPC